MWVSERQKKVLLCDDSEFNQCYFYNMGNAKEMDDIISNVPLPLEL